MERCHPALLIVHPSRTNPDAVPPASEVTEVITDALESGGWTTPSDMLIDVREGALMIQDEVPPADPVEWYGVAAVFSQLPATFTHGYRGPFRSAMEGVHEEYPELEIHIDAVPGPGGKG